MRNSIPFSPKSLTLAIMLAGISHSANAQQEPEIEEVVVTGSYIRGTPLDAPSPVQIIDRESIEAQGAAVIWDVIKNLEVNSGSFVNPGSGEVEQTQGTAQVNLRNLGENSTLTLINGKRMAPAGANTRGGGEFVDLNMIPLVMTERIEVLTDGGSALYGADAVAGVVNVIMRTDFEGFEIYGDLQGIEKASGLYDATVSAIWGWASDDGDTHFVVSAERFERDPVTVRDGNNFDGNAEYLGAVTGFTRPLPLPFLGARLNPAWINFPITQQNVAEGGSRTPIFTDPGCYTYQSADGQPAQFGSLRTLRGETSGNCFEDASEWSLISNESKRDSFAGAFNHTFADGTEFYSFANYSDSTINRADDGYYSYRIPNVYLAQPGAHGGRFGRTLELGYFAPAVGLTRPTSIPNVPTDGANGGPNAVSFGQPRTGLPRYDAKDNGTWANGSSVQLGLRGEIELAERTLNYDVSYSFSQSSLEVSGRNFIKDRTDMAVNGLGGPDCVPNGTPNFDFAHQPGDPAWGNLGRTLLQNPAPGVVFHTREAMSYALTSNNHGQGGCEFYNPFLSRFSDPSLANSAELMDYIHPKVLTNDKRNRLGVFDAVVTGDLVELPGGMAQFAVGAQYRERNTLAHNTELDTPGLQSILSYDANGVPNDYLYVGNSHTLPFLVFEYDHDRTSTAGFAELSLPLWENVETQFAVRWEDYGGVIGDEISPKVAVSWRPVDTMLLRASWSESFRAPNIAIIEQGLEGNLVTFKDVLKDEAVRAGLLPPTPENAQNESVDTRGGPSPGLGNEYADTYNIGVLWTPEGSLDGLSIGADVWRFEVSDRVLPEPTERAMIRETEAFVAAAANPANYILGSTDSSSAPMQFVPCNPAALEAEFGVDSPERLDCQVDPRKYQVSGIQLQAFNNNRNVTSVSVGSINAGVIEADGVDIKMGYSWDSDWGQFRAGLDYTYVRQYKLKNVPGLIAGLSNTGVYDAAGTTGDNNLVRSLPDNKGHLTFNWRRDNHGVTVINRHIGSYRDLTYQATFDTSNDFRRSLLQENIESYQTWDMQYNYSHDWSNQALGTTRFSLGILDAFNAALPVRESGGLNYDAQVFDARGRRLYARVLMQF